MLEWILGHLQIVIPIVLGLIWLLGNRSNPAEDDAPAPTPRRQVPQYGPTPGQRRVQEAQEAANERARQIQEEIRRKILERQRRPAGGEAPPPQRSPVEPVPPPPLVVTLPPPIPQARMPDPGADRFPSAAPVGPAEVEDSTAAVLEAARRRAERATAAAAAAIAEQSARLAGVAGSVESTMERAFARPATGAGHGAALFASDLRDDLRGKESLRRAVVLREILGRPAGW